LRANIWRTVELQAKWGLQNHVPGDITDISILEEYVYETKPESALEKQFRRQGYSVLVYTQFLYPVPVPPDKAARFRPAYHPKNVFYGAIEIETSFYETAYYFMKERILFKKPTSSAEPKTVFEVGFKDSKAQMIHGLPNIAAIMDRNDYSASHAYTKATVCNSIYYPSARRAEGNCIAAYEIEVLDKEPSKQMGVRFTFDGKKQACKVDTDSGEIWIEWKVVS